MEDLKIPEGWAPTKRSKSKHKGDLFAKLWRWHLRLLLEKRASGRLLRLYLVLVDEDFKSFGKPFAVTTDMALRAGIDRHLKAKLLDTLEQLGVIFQERRGNKNPQVALRQFEGRGQSPFLT
jgi:hypothetical protein